MDTDALIRYIVAAARDDGAIIIQPHKEPFLQRQRTFLDGLKVSPARITAPPTGDPFQRILQGNGHWLFIWVPEGK